MPNWERICSLLALVIAPCLMGMLWIFPELRQLERLLPICLLGIIINIGLLFLILRDIFLRRFNDPNMRFLWIAAVLFFWPSIFYYLFRHGFRPRN